MRTYLILLISALTLISCDINYTEPEELNTKQVFRFEVKKADWTPYTDESGLNLYYRCNFDIKGITQYIVENGAVLGYIEFDGYQQALPYTRHMENADGARWSRTIDFDFSRTDVQFYVTNNDFVNDPPETMYFRVVFVW
ncbi:MAG: hypothetical protein PHU68_12610 [Paludibacter sp.]|jgi:hypothetical protein|nr:hypothetical protein [Paludibacter sp.]